ncbi:acyl-CoA dehydrogenase family protein [Streptomyces sp. VMFN-G11Ma]|uniref:acyl-CoA dehydrogenase family protein n=1 Tax=Streptomyces sp. VMFN-G11Ma TaxID=2135609 RepID=UPI000D3D0605|nr:acyl-CoA dehydrogenase family protein [Streptomyces sp. VMFN-G11Ma]PTM89828.1 alkylation response protein AidB-like acyl-CoA dehydrogenase [Streptomyces sp. VMFN-G11Ma]
MALEADKFAIADDQELLGHEELYRSALNSARLARSLAPVTEEQRGLAGELVRRLVDDELLRTGVPRSVGGPMASPSVMLRCAETVARGDASAGWCVSIAMTSSLLGAYLPRKGTEEVFGDPRSVASGVWAPTARARTVQGGVVVSGRWAFCSGISHADWLFAGCLLDPSKEQPGSPVMRVVALPKQQLEVLDTWHTGGLRGTASHDAVADEVFVPDHRILSLVQGPPADAEPLHRFPAIAFFALSVAAAALGNARGAIDDLTALAGDNTSRGSSRGLAERSSAQIAVAQAEASLRAARLLYYQSVDDAWQAAQSSEPVPQQLRVGLRLAGTHAARVATEVTDTMYELAGGAAVYETSPLQRRFRDAHTMTAHIQLRPTMYKAAGAYLLGQPVPDQDL